MAERFNRLLAGRFNTLARSLLGLEEQEGITSVAPDLFAGITLESDRPEYHFLANSRLWIAAGQDPGVAANISNLGIFLPTASNVLSIIKRIIITNREVTAQLYNIRTSLNPTRDGTGLLNFLDSRFAGSPQSVIFDRTAVATIGTQVSIVEIPAGTTAYVDVDFILGGSRFNAVSFDPTTVAIEALGSFWGYERPARPSELA